MLEIKKKSRVSDYLLQNQEEKRKIVDELQKLFEKAESDKEQQKILLKTWKRKLQRQVKSLNDLTIKKVIGNGSEGMLFKCDAAGTEVALKIMFNYGVSTSQVQLHFANECKILKLLPVHPNIVPLLHEFKKTVPHSAILSIFLAETFFYRN